MVTSGNMVTALAHDLGEKRSRVEGVDRILSEAGLRTTGGKGRSAAKMTGMDIVNVMFPLLMNSGVSDAPEVAAKVSNLQRFFVVVAPASTLDPAIFQDDGQSWEVYNQAADIEFPFGAALLGKRTFGQVLAYIVDALAAGSLEFAGGVAIHVRILNSGRVARILFQVGHRVLKIDFAGATKGEDAAFSKRTCELTRASLQKLADIIRTE